MEVLLKCFCFFMKISSYSLMVIVQSDLLPSGSSTLKCHTRCIRVKSLYCAPLDKWIFLLFFIYSASLCRFYLRKNKSSMNPGQLTLLASTFCVMLTMHFSGQLLAEHLLSWKKPKEQKAIIIIILMAPIYAIDSFVGLVDFQGSKAFFMLLESVKECYEALVKLHSQEL